MAEPVSSQLPLKGEVPTDHTAIAFGNMEAKYIPREARASCSQHLGPVRSWRASISAQINCPTWFSYDVDKAGSPSSSLMQEGKDRRALLDSAYLDPAMNRVLILKVGLIG